MSNYVICHIKLSWGTIILILVMNTFGYTCYLFAMYKGNNYKFCLAYTLFSPTSFGHLFYHCSHFKFSDLENTIFKVRKLSYTTNYEFISTCILTSSLLIKIFLGFVLCNVRNVMILSLFRKFAKKTFKIDHRRILFYILSL